MGTYILQPCNYVSQYYFTNHAPQKTFVLSVHNATQYQLCEIVNFRDVLESYAVIFNIPVYFITVECSDLVARSPPLLAYQVV